MSKNKVIWAVSVAAILVAAIVVRTVRAQAVGVPGSYLVRASVPQTMPGFPTSFHLLAAFTGDNTIISVDQTDTDPVGEKGLESPAVGVWRFGQLGVDVTLWSFWASRKGEPLGVLRVRGHGSMDPATGKVAGSATFDFFKAGKDPLADQPDLTVPGGTFEATRLSVVPVD